MKEVDIGKKEILCLFLLLFVVTTPWTFFVFGWYLFLVASFIATSLLVWCILIVNDTPFKHKHYNLLIRSFVPIPLSMKFYINKKRYTPFIEKIFSELCIVGGVISNVNLLALVAATEGDTIQHPQAAFILFNISLCISGAFILFRVVLMFLLWYMSIRYYNKYRIVVEL